MSLPERPSDRKVESIIAYLLTAGVALAAFTVLSGGILYLVHYGATSPDYRTFRGEPSELPGVAGILTNAMSLHSRAIMQLGLLMLIATPVSRVAFCVVAFVRQQDRLYVMITLFVLTLLMISLIGGMR